LDVYERSIIFPVDKTEQARVFATLVLAFAADPVEGWLYPESQQYLSHFPKFLFAFGDRAFAEQAVWRLGAFSAVALWFPPGTEPDGDAITNTLAETVSPELHADTFAVLDQMGTAHPDYPHWYLPWFGVDTALQGKGLGGQLMKPCLQIVDASHLPAYLETPNPRTTSFYERHGFEVTGKAQAGSLPADHVHAAGCAVIPESSRRRLPRLSGPGSCTACRGADRC
jgi:GNAT superfamily N-acetyltransferase